MRSRCRGSHAILLTQPHLHCPKGIFFLSSHVLTFTLPAQFPHLPLCRSAAECALHSYLDPADSIAHRLLECPTRATALLANKPAATSAYPAAGQQFTFECFNMS